MDRSGIEPETPRMLSGCDTPTPPAPDEPITTDPVNTFVFVTMWLVPTPRVGARYTRTMPSHLSTYHGVSLVACGNPMRLPLHRTARPRPHRKLTHCPEPSAQLYRTCRQQTTNNQNDSQQPPSRRPTPATIPHQPIGASCLHTTSTHTPQAARHAF